MPYQRAMLDDACDYEAGEVVWRIASQLGKTACLVLASGYYIHQRPSPILVVYPTLDSAKAWVKQKFTPAIRDTPCMRGLIKDPRSRDAENTTLNKRFPGGFINIVGANSPSGLRQRSVRVVIMDEIDAYEPNSEGDPVAQAEKRSETFHDAIKIKSSTPTIRGSPLDVAWERSDKQLWFCPCPNCGHEQPLRWEQLRWPENRPDEAWYECEKCSHHWTDQERIAAILSGRWKATAPFNGVRGRHLSGLYRLIGRKRSSRSYLHEFASEFIKAKRGGRESLMVWTNTFLADNWSEEGVRIESEPLLKRREAYTKAPAGVFLVTAGIDVQGDRLELELVGWGPGEESWGLGYRVLYGSPLTAEVWKELDTILTQELESEDGRKLKVLAACVDSGGEAGVTSEVYRFAKPRTLHRVFAVKGSSESAKPIVATVSRNNRMRCPVYIIGTDTAKATLFGRLALTKPGDGFMHYSSAEPMRYDEGYFSGLTAEEAQLIKMKGFPKRVWVKIRDRNEPLDCRVYALAALGILNPNWVSLNKVLGKPKPKTNIEAPAASEVQQPADPSGQPVPKDPNALPESPVKRKSPKTPRRSGWINGWR